jgi:hypothetical protein
MAKNRVHKGDFSKLSTGEFPVFTGSVEFVNRSGPAGPVPALGNSRQYTVERSRCRTSITDKSQQSNDKLIIRYIYIHR